MWRGFTARLSCVERQRFQIFWSMNLDYENGYCGKSVFH